MDMSKNTLFVVSAKTVRVSDSISVEKGNVGILESSKNRQGSIFFIRVWRKVNLDKSEYRAFDVNKTGDNYSLKICNVCHKLKKTKMFAKNQNAKNNRSVRRPSCKTCRREMEGVNIKSKDKIKWLKSKPSREPFQCPICSKRTIAGITSKIVLEHDHRTGKVRGWICDSCNTGLGRFKDNKKILLKAIKFIE